MAKIYFDNDADLSVLSGKQIAIIGYGNQGRAQALNMRDSGITDIVVGSTGTTDHPAAKDGFKVLTISEASRKADIIFVLIPDEVMPDVYHKEIGPNLISGNVLNFASGYNITFKLIQPPKHVDVIMLAPRMIGDGVRNLFLSGEGYPAFVAIEQDASGHAKSIAVALARAIGATKKGTIEVTFKDETMMDLLAEQAIWPMITAILTESFRFEVEKGHPAEASLVELYLSMEPAYMFEKMAKEGLFKQLPYHSHTSQYGQLSRFEKLDKRFIRSTLEKAYDYIESGQFAREWKDEQRNGLPEFKRLLHEALNSEISKLEEKLIPVAESPNAQSSLILNERVITDAMVRQAVLQKKRSIAVAANAILTPSAQDRAREFRIEVIRKPA
jgi:ketol-acid reductoisomerase